MAVGEREVVFRIKLRWLWAIAALAVGLIVWFGFASTATRPLIVFIAAVIAGAGTLTTAINNIDQRAELAAREGENARRSAESLAATSHEARVAAALEVFYRWNSPQFFHCKKGVRETLEKFKATSKIDDQLEYLAGHADRWPNLFDMLNVFEALNIAIDNHVVDEPTAKRFFRSIVRRYWHQTEPIINKLRADHQNGRLYCEFESLFKRWDVS